MHRTIATLLMFCLLWFACGCASYGGKSADMAPSRTTTSTSHTSGDDLGRAQLQRDGDFRMAQNNPEGAAPPPPAPPMKPGTNPRPPKTANKAVPLLIYTATLHMAVFEAKAALTQTQKLAEKMGGYLVKRSDNQIVIRVPSGKFKGALAAIAKKGDVLHRRENVEDVTERFYDLQTRLNNARAMRARFVKLLEQAQSVKDALAVEKELARVTTVIERIEGKLKRMKELISFSTITVVFKPAPTQRVPFP